MCHNNSSKPTTAVGTHLQSWWWSKREIQLSFQAQSRCTALKVKVCCGCLSLPCCNRQPQSQKASSPSASPKLYGSETSKIPTTMFDGGYIFSDTSKPSLWKEVKESYYLLHLLSPVQFLMASQLMLLAFKP